MANWTKEQTGAIEIDGKNALVCAGAGSGKTAVLTQRIANIVASGIGVKKMLVATFTKSAANEMKNRVCAKFEQMLSDATSEQTKWLKEQIQDIGSSNISTLHSFCTLVLRRHFNEVGIDPAFRVGDEYEKLLLRNAAMEQVLTQRYEKKDENFINLLDQFDAQEERLVESVLKIYEQTLANVNPTEFFQNATQHYKQDVKQLQKSIHVNALFIEANKNFQSAKQYMKKAIDIIPTDIVFEKYSNALKEHCSQIENVCDMLEKQDVCAFEKASAIKAPVATWPKKDVGVELAFLKDKAQAYRDAAKGISKKYKENAIIYDFVRQASILNQTHSAVKAFCDLVMDFAEAFAKIKNKNNVVDFSDLEHLTIRVLQNPNIQKEYREQFEYIFVDEYQDTNGVQEKIVSLCSKKDNVFCVGDVKQSIYKFRQADPQIFIKKQTSYCQNEVDGKLFLLNKNFRSCGNVLDSINDIFSKAMEIEGELTYQQEDYLYAGRKLPKQQNQPTVDLQIIDLSEHLSDQTNEKEPQSEKMIRDKIALEATMAANTILQTLEQQIFDVKTNEFRKAEFSDVAVLMRSASRSAEVFAKIFSSKGIPCYCELSSGYFEAIEVQVLLNFLKIIDNSERDVELLSVCRGKMLNISDNEIIQIRKNNPKISFLKAMEKESTNSSQLGEKCKKAMDFIQQQKQNALVVDVETLIEELIEQTQYLTIISALRFGEQRVANIEMFLQRARDFCENSNRGLADFIFQIESLKQAGAGIGEARLVSEGMNCVSIMTIHRSKGLEFPIVVLANLGKKFNYKDMEADVVVHKKLGIGIKFFEPKERVKDTNIIFEAIKAQGEREIRAEELRLLYVGMTRAQEKLIMIATTTNARKNLQKWQDGAKAKTMLDYIMQALVQYKQTNSQIFKIFGGDKTTINSIETNRANWNISAQKIEYITDSQFLKKNDQKEFEKWKEKALDKDFSIWEKILFQTKQNVALPSKIAVSSIPRFKKVSFDPIPNFNKGQVSGAEIGQATHKVLQNIKLNQVIDNEAVLRCIKKLVQEEIIAVEQGEKIKVSSIVNFFNSPLGKNMQSSKRVLREQHFTFMEKASTIFRSNKDFSEKIEKNQASDVEIAVQGVIDACFLQDEKWVLIDYKTDFVFHINQESIQKEKLLHTDQIELYSKALQKLTGIQVCEKYLVLLSADYNLSID